MTKTTLDRRSFLGRAGLGGGAAAAATALAAPAIAQDAPEVKWRLQSSFPQSLDTLYGGAVAFAETVSALTDGRFRIDVGEGGRFVPGPQALDAVQNDTVEIAQTCSYYYIGKDPAFAIGTALPFGLNARMQNAWIIDGGGQKLLDDFYAGYNVVSFLAGNTGVQMGGWFRNEIKGIADLDGLKMRIAGLGGTVMAKLGVVPQQIAGSGIYPALEKGTIDAAEWVGPYDDEKLGFYQVAKFYYYPGFWEGGPSIHLFVNKAKWDALPPAYQAALRTAAAQANELMLAKYDVRNTTAVRSLVGKGVQLRPFPRDVLEAAYAASFALYAELSAGNASFKAIYDPWKQFRDQSYQWFRVGEYTFDSFGFAQQAKGL